MSSLDDFWNREAKLLPEDQATLDRLRQEIEPALARLDRGEGVSLDMEAIKAEARQRLSPQASLPERR